MKYTITLLSLLSFHFLFGQACDGLTSITYNGDTYELVEIGNQCWFKENLRTTKYKDGTPIDYPGSDNVAWANSYTDSTGAYAWYNNDSVNNAQNYGALYNWYAVGNSSGLCPTGWVVPTDSAWGILDSFLAHNGYNYDGSTAGRKYGKAMADTIHWLVSTTPGSIGNTDYPSLRNQSGFSALPGGIRDDNGAYQNAGSMGFWWTATDIELFLGYYPSFYRRMWYFMWWVSGGPPTDAENKTTGMSIRCLKDTSSTTTSIINNENGLLKLYPNPLKTSTTIELSSEQQNLVIYDLAGNKVREGLVSGNTVINRGDLKKGIYIIEVSSTSQTYTGKLIVE